MSFFDRAMVSILKRLVVVVAAALIVSPKAGAQQDDAVQIHIEKLRRIKLSHFQFKDATLSEAIDLLRAETRKADFVGLNSPQWGIPIAILDQAAARTNMATDPIIIF